MTESLIILALSCVCLIIVTVFASLHLAFLAAELRKIYEKELWEYRKNTGNMITYDQRQFKKPIRRKKGN